MCGHKVSFRKIAGSDRDKWRERVREIHAARLDYDDDKKKLKYIDQSIDK